LFRLLRANPVAVELADDEEFFRKIAGAIIKIAPPVGQVSREAEQAVKQFVSQGLSAGEGIDVFELSGDARPEGSILSDEFLDKITKGLARPELGVAILKKILSDEISVRSRTNRMQAQLFGDRLRAVLDRYDARQITSGEVIERLVELARQVRDARRRHEALGLSVEEVAFYDALADSSDDWAADERLANIARALVRGIKEDLSVDWADHEATEAAIKVKISGYSVAISLSRTGSVGAGVSIGRLARYSTRHASSTASGPRSRSATSCSSTPPSLSGWAARR
jgi:type I restriction enzyme R subunit